MSISVSDHVLQMSVLEREIEKRDFALSAARSEAQKARAFKEYVHKRLDEAGVPVDPEPEHNRQHGCRIEGRLNYVLAEVQALEAEEANHEVCTNSWTDHPNEHEHPELSLEESGLAHVARWVREYKAKLAADPEGGVFDSTLKCISEGGEVFYIDPEEIEAAEATAQKARAELEDYKGRNGMTPLGRGWLPPEEATALKAEAAAYREALEDIADAGSPRNREAFVMLGAGAIRLLVGKAQNALSSSNPGAQLTEKLERYEEALKELLASCELDDLDTDEGQARGLAAMNMARAALGTGDGT
jgi:hypothetical protein